MQFMQGFDFRDVFSNIEQSEKFNYLCDEAAVELERYQRIETAAKLVLTEDERVPSLNQYILGLKAAVEE